MATLSPVTICPCCNSPLSTSPPNYKLTHSAHLPLPAGPGVGHTQWSLQAQQEADRFFYQPRVSIPLASRSSSFPFFSVFSSHLQTSLPFFPVPQHWSDTSSFPISFWLIWYLIPYLYFPQIPSWMIVWLCFLRFPHKSVCLCLATTM